MSKFLHYKAVGYFSHNNWQYNPAETKTLDITFYIVLIFGILKVKVPVEPRTSPKVNHLFPDPL